MTTSPSSTVSLIICLAWHFLVFKFSSEFKNTCFYMYTQGKQSHHYYCKKVDSRRHCCSNPKPKALVFSLPLFSKTISIWDKQSSHLLWWNWVIWLKKHFCSLFSSMQIVIFEKLISLPNFGERILMITYLNSPPTQFFFPQPFNLILPNCISIIKDSALIYLSVLILSSLFLAT